MGVNSNHTVEELGGTRCAIVEKNISQERADFLTAILTGNGYTVVCAEAAPAKAPKAAEPAEGEAPAAPVLSGPVLLNLGVTDILFNPINAVFGRLLKSSDGHFVTLAYWNQQSASSDDEKPYFLASGS